MTTYDENYQRAYQALNTEQARAVDSIEGPVLVIAGPGTGKTQILTLRIVNIIRQTDIPPDAILALTFTEAAAQAMRDRLRRYLGAVAYQVNIYTFHGFAERCISRFPDHFPRIVGGKPASDIERYELIKSILQSASWQVLRPKGNPDYYVHMILQQISACKREYVRPDNVTDWLARESNRLVDMPQYHESGAHKGKVRSAYTMLARSIEKHQEFVSVYRQYEALLQSKDRYDFDDMITEVVQVLQSDEDLLRTLQEQYQYVLADEHQDVNESQNQLLLLLAAYHERPNIFVVGDEKQAIYRFQGASLSNFLFFSDHFTDTATIQLTQNYRSGQSVLDVAHQVITTEDPDLQALRVPLTAAVPAAAVSLRSFSHTTAERSWLVDEIKSLLKQDFDPAEIAVIVRTNRAVEDYATLLRSHGISVNASADGAINHHPFVISMRTLLQAVVDPRNESALARVLHAPYWGLRTMDLVRLLSGRSRETTLLQLLYDETKQKELGVIDTECVKKIVDVLELVRVESECLLPHRLVERVLQVSGWLAYIQAHDPVEAGRVVRRVYDTIIDAVQRNEVRSLPELVNFLALHEQYGISLQAPFLPTSGAAVNVMTAHKAKGLEYDVVFMPDLVDSVWGGGRNRTTFSIPLTKTDRTDQVSNEDDDRRLLYVGMTRARHTLYLSYATLNHDGRDRVMSRLLAPLDEVSETVLERPETKAYSEALEPLTTFGSQSTQLAIDAAFLRETLLCRGLSPTSLQNYRTHPWTYLYRNVLRVPELPTLSLQYGTAMHTVLERAVTYWQKQQAVPEVGQFSHWLHVALEAAPLSPVEHNQLHEQGLAALAVYHAHLSSQLQTVSTAVTEQHVRCDLPVQQDGTLTTVPVTGVLDRVDRDRSGQIKRVVDYKTGKPRSRQAIIGQTKGSDGSYFKQLVFYALLLQLQSEHHDSIAYTLTFVEPNSKDVIKEEEFYITETDIAELRHEIELTAEAIATGAFLTTPCDETVCDYCQWLTLHRLGLAKEI